MLNSSKRFTFIVVFLALLSNCQQKETTVEPTRVLQKAWDRTYGGSESDNLFTTVAALDGGYLLAGSSASNVSGDKSESSRGDNDYWVIKTGANGMLQWSKTFGGTSTDIINTAIPTKDGGFLLAGYSYSNASGDKSESNRGHKESYDCWLVKIDANGNKQWDKTLGGTGYDEAKALTATPDGGYLVGVYSTSPASGDKSESGYGGADYWLIKLGANGNKQWDKTLGGDETLSAITMTPDGGILLAGSSASNASGDKSENSKGKSDLWLVKVNANGTKQWDKTLGGSGTDIIDGYNPIVLTSDGGLLLGASSQSDASGDKSKGNKGDFDYWLVKVDTNGNKQWDKTFGSVGADLGSTLTASPDGGFLLGSRSGSGQSGDKSEQGRGNIDYWVMKVAADGTKQWDKTLGGSGLDYLVSVLTAADGGFLLGGFSLSNTSGEKSDNSKGKEDFWIVKMN